MWKEGKRQGTTALVEARLWRGLGSQAMALVEGGQKTGNHCTGGNKVVERAGLTCNVACGRQAKDRDPQPQ